MSVKRVLLLAVGFLSFGLGTAGIFLPVIPTVPLYLLAGACFAAASARVNGWFIKTKLYKKHLLPYLQAGGLPLKGKIGLILFVSLQMAVGAFFARGSVIALIAIGLLFLGFLYSMLFVVKTVKDDGKRLEKRKKRGRSAIKKRRKD